MSRKPMSIRYLTLWGKLMDSARTLNQLEIALKGAHSRRTTIQFKKSIARSRSMTDS